MKKDRLILEIKHLDPATIATLKSKDEMKISIKKELIYSYENVKEVYEDVENIKFIMKKILKYY